jgi:hypothetical protein
MIIGSDPRARVAITTPTRKAATNLAKEVARQLGVRSCFFVCMLCVKRV